jgi:hypothetical protein
MPTANPRRRRAGRQDLALFDPAGNDSPASAPAARVALFVVDRRLFDREAGGWLNPLQAAPATCRGRLYRDSRDRRGLVPDPSATPVRGQLVEVLPEQLPVLDFVAGVQAGEVRRVGVLATQNLRSVEAQTWALVDPFGWTLLPGQST